MTVMTVTDSDLTCTSAETLLKVFFDETGKLNEFVTKLDEASVSILSKDAFVNHVIDSFFKDDAKITESLEITVKDMRLRYHTISIDTEYSAQVIECNNPASIWINLNPSRTDTWMGFVELHSE